MFPQGSILSPVVFALYLEYAIRDIRTFIREKKGELIQYADDTLIMVHIAQVDKLKQLVKKMEDQWDMRINWLKSDCFLLGKGTKKKLIQGIGNKVTELKYLGIILSKNIFKSAKSRLRKLIKERTTKYQKRIYATLDQSSRIRM